VGGWVGGRGRSGGRLLREKEGGRRRAVAREHFFAADVVFSRQPHKRTPNFERPAAPIAEAAIAASSLSARRHPPPHQNRGTCSAAGDACAAPRATPAKSAPPRHTRAHGAVRGSDDSGADIASIDTAAAMAGKSASPPPPSRRRCRPRSHSALTRRRRQNCAPASPPLTPAHRVVRHLTAAYLPPAPPYRPRREGRQPSGRRRRRRQRRL